MSEIESKLIGENEKTKELFNFHGDETQHKHIKECFADVLRNSKNSPNYFIILLENYSCCQKDLLNAFIHVFHNKSVKFNNILKTTQIFSNSSFSQRHFQ